MTGLVLFGELCGSLNNVFVHISGQNTGNDMRKDCFRKIMTFSFPQLNRYGAGSLVTRVTNDIMQVQNFVSQFVRGMIRTLMLTFGSMYCMFRLNVRFGKGSTTSGTIMAAITYTTQLLNGILMLVMLFQNISKGLVSWKINADPSEWHRGGNDLRICDGRCLQSAEGNNR